MDKKSKAKQNHSKFKAFLDVMRTRTIAFTATFTARYCTQTLTHSHSLRFLLSSPSLRTHTTTCPRTKPQHTHTHSHSCTQSTYKDSGASAQYVQVHGWGLGEALEHAVDLLDVQPHVGLPLPAAQHQVVHLFRTGAGPLQHAALGDALDHLQDTRWKYTVCSGVHTKAMQQISHKHC